MNMQAIMAQAQRMQKDILNKKNEIDNMDFVGKSNWVEVSMKGNKKVVNVNFLCDDCFNKENKDILSDMITIAMNDAIMQIDKTTEDKLGAYKNMGGLM